MESAPEKGTVCASNASETPNVWSWNHSEIWTHQDGSHLKIDPGEYIGTDKRPLFGKRQWGPHELARTHTETVEIILVSLWEYVSVYYLLSFQVTTFLGFYHARNVLRGSGRLLRGPLHPGATIS